MERLFEGKDKIIVDADAGGSGVIPYLPLNELTRQARRSQASGDRPKGELDGDGAQRVHVAQPIATLALDVEFFKQPNPQPDQDRRAEPELEWTSGGKRRHQTKACEDERRYQHEQRLAARRGTESRRIFHRSSHRPFALLGHERNGQPLGAAQHVERDVEGEHDVAGGAAAFHRRDLLIASTARS